MKKKEIHKLCSNIIAKRGGAKMRILLIIISILVLATHSVVAVSPSNNNLISEAQRFGKLQVNNPDFFIPWTVYEEKSETLNESAEQAILYTPFLLVAADTKNRIHHDQNYTIGNAIKTLNDYSGFFVFDVILLSKDKTFINNIQSTLQQEKTVVQAYHPSYGELEIFNSPNGLFRVHVYLYFLQNEFYQDCPVRLIVRMDDNRTRTFYFDLGRIQ